MWTGMTKKEQCESPPQWIHEKNKTQKTTVERYYRMSEHLHIVSQSDTDTKSHLTMHSKRV